MTPNAQSIKEKNQQTAVHQNLQLLLYKRAYEENAYKLQTENICKPCT